MRICVVLGLFVLLSLSVAKAQDAGIVAKGVVIGQADTKPGTTSVMRVDQVGAEGADSAVGMYLFGTGVLGQDGDGNTVARFSWQAVGKTADLANAESVEPVTPALTSEFPLSGSTVIPGNTETFVEGDGSGLVRAVKELGKRDSGGSSGGDAVVDVGGRDSASSGNEAIPAGSEDSSNDLATPPQLTVTEKPSEVIAPVIADVLGISVAGCEPILDIDPATGLGTVTLTEKLTRNGIPEGDCLPSATTASIDRSGIGCGYDIRIDELKAVEMDRRFYVIGGSTTNLDTTCVINEASTFKVDEVSDGCAVVRNGAGTHMVQHTKLEFRGRDNGQVPVAGCEERNGRQAVITPSTIGCDLRDDFAGKRSYQRSKATYIDERGNVQSSGECEETGVNYTHFRDSTVCDDFVDFDQNAYFQQYRIRVDLPDGPKFRTPVCTPFETQLTGLQETAAGCESLYTNLFDQSVSKGFKQLIRIDTQESVRGCQQSADIDYVHRFEANGSNPDDANLQSIPLLQTYIDLPAPYGKTIIRGPQVLANSIPVPYTAVGAVVVRDGNVDYQSATSCNAFTDQAEYQNYQRLDGTSFEQKVQDLPASGPGDGCTEQISRSWPFVGGSGTARYTCRARKPDSCGDCSDGHSALFATRSTCNYRADRRFLRNDGIVLAPESRNYGVGISSPCGGGPLPSCAATVDDLSTIGSAASGFGWFVEGHF